MITAFAACLASSIVMLAIISHVRSVIAADPKPKRESLARTSEIASRMVMRRRSTGFAAGRLGSSAGAVAAMVAGLATGSPARADEISMQQLALLQQFNLVDLGSLSRPD